MSDAALKYVHACTHPKVKGGVLAVFTAIAELIPEGQTTTPLIGMEEDIVPTARVHRVTVVKRLKVLVDIKEVAVLDGGQGSRARYTIVNLAGDRPITAIPLPLRADLRTVPRTARPARETMPGLFDAVVEPAGGEEPAINLLRSATSTRRQLVAIGYKLVLKVLNMLRSATSWGSNLLRSATSSHPLDGTRARATYYHLETTTTTAPLVDPPTATARAKPPPCRWHGTTPMDVHAWCEFRVHMPMQLHLELRRKLARRPGETDADLDARLFARYAEIAAAIPDDQPIDENDFDFWKRRLRAAAVTSAAETTRDVYAEAEAHQQQRQRRRGWQ